MKKIGLLVVFGVGAAVAQAQPLTKAYIDNLVKATNNHVPLVHNYKYFLPYSGFYEAKDSLKLNKKLRAKTAKDLLRVVLMHPIGNTEEALGVELFSQGFITIELKSRQPKQQKREMLAEAKEIFATGSKNPILVINEVRVSPDEAKATIAKLKFEELDAIAIYYRALSTSVYGQQGADGMIQIWTRPLKK
ncbi:hypothetical protein VRU48_16230 [Pedobacter sp. KR3-3]|uniref:DUF4252 domain-containing protein n=1 Tax=Pedobacter albus TaxID=3113905 RepID=A0ABU7IB29_9SPHI|nr:hypothetical protein [Pedobacter sp. KR3-3]MEE1946673.1 hypothetical protein [Pedobacter sp. KR3-3]